MERLVLLEMIRYFGDDARRINHALKVYSFARAITTSEDIQDDLLTIINYAAILHDIGIHEAERKHNSPGGKYQEIEGPAIAGEILERLDIPEEIIHRVLFLIGNHHSYNKIDNIDFQILVEADFLVNAFEDEMTRESIESVERKIFKTEAGKEILQSMYLAELPVMEKPS